MYKPSLLVVDDETTICKSLQRVLEKEGYDVDICYDGKSAMEAVSAKFYDVVLTDLKMPGAGGLEVLKRTREDSPETAVFIMTNYSTVETAVEAMRMGAKDYIIKPFLHDDIKMSIQGALAEGRLVSENKLLKRELGRTVNQGEFVGDCPQIKEVYRLVDKVALTDSSVLIVGESGSGKELVARAIHQRSSRAVEPFVAINCGALPSELLESELFGHVKGAFTGAVASRPGLFQEARGGTLLFDEIGELPMDLQVKLLRALQEKEIRPVGSNKSIRTDARIITATNKKLEQEVEEKKFREDLYFRINVLTIEMPPLRERGEDIGKLANHFLAVYGPRINKAVKNIAPEMMRLLHAYNWPGNVRELENVIERALILEESDTLTADTLPRKMVVPSSDPRPGAVDGRLSIDEYIQSFIQRYENEYKEKDIAEMLGISRKSLWEKRKRWGIERASIRKEEK
ncbi:MAG: sigma-54 dependent transcriptional regulator [Nitrospinota bacterium]|nr:sigma-54 dependent transcriptional regulator [Nitrospinota bacterium]